MAEEGREKKYSKHWLTTYETRTLYRGTHSLREAE